MADWSLEDEMSFEWVTLECSNNDDDDNNNNKNNNNNNNINNNNDNNNINNNNDDDDDDDDDYDDDDDDDDDYHLRSRRPIVNIEMGCWIINNNSVLFLASPSLLSQ